MRHHYSARKPLITGYAGKLRGNASFWAYNRHYGKGRRDRICTGERSLNIRDLLVRTNKYEYTMDQEL